MHIHFIILKKNFYVANLRSFLLNFRVRGSSFLYTFFSSKIMYSVFHLASVLLSFLLGALALFVTLSFFTDKQVQKWSLTPFTLYISCFVWCLHVKQSLFLLTEIVACANLGGTKDYKVLMDQFHHVSTAFLELGRR